MLLKHYSSTEAGKNVRFENESRKEINTIKSILLPFANYGLISYSKILQKTILQKKFYN